jgi:molybdopterin-guanine dinucleotide biosynthesis protein A
MTSAIILAGGESRRMGQDKASMLLLGKPLLQHVIDRVAPSVDDVIIVTRPWQSLPGITGLRPRAEGRPRPVVVVEDAFPGKGPLGGLYTGLAVATSFPAFAVACDMPLIQSAMIEALLSRTAGYNAVVPLRFGLAEPLCAAYDSACLTALRQRIERGELAMRGWLDDVRTRYFAEADWLTVDPAASSFFNVNTPEDLVKAESLLRA